MSRSCHLQEQSLVHGEYSGKTCSSYLSWLLYSLVEEPLYFLNYSPQVPTAITTANWFYPEGQVLLSQTNLPPSPLPLTDMSPPFLGLTCIEVYKAKTGCCRGSHRIPGHEPPACPHLKAPLMAPAPGFHHWRNGSPKGEAP